MNPGTVVGSLDLAVARGKKHSTKREHIVSRAIHREIPKVKDMKQYDHQYATGIVSFKNRLAADLQNAADQRGDKGSVFVHIEQGRKFDKVVVGVKEPGVERVKMETRFFVDQKDGSIYGMKSPLSPNLTHFYGTVHNSEQWDWSKDHPEPFDAEKAGVVVIGGYGGYKHYVRKEEAATPTRRRAKATT